MVPLVEPVFFGFLKHPPVAWGPGVQGVLLRASLVVIAVVALDVYAAVIRGPDRAVLDLHPVDPAQVVPVQVWTVASQRWLLVLLLAVLLSPIGVAGAWGMWGLCVAVLCGAFVLSLSASAMVHLLAIEAAQNPRWEGVLDLLRGSNPRPQAAFIYAPGVVLGGCAVVMSMVGGAAIRLAEGDTSASLWLALPFVVAALCATQVSRLARDNWFQASGVLADIDARYVTTTQQEEGRSVFLDWLVRFLPAKMAVWALKDLRHGWRARRAWITGAWFAGAAAALAGWSSASEAAGSATAIVIAAVWLLTAVGVLMDQDEPEFLRAWLPHEGWERRGARLFVLCAWMQSALWPAFFVLWLKHGRSAAGMLLLAGMISALGASLLALGSALLRDRALLMYGPLAALSAAVFALQFTAVSP